MSLIDRDNATCGADPHVAILSLYDVHVPHNVIGEMSTTANGGDLLAAAVTVVLCINHHLSSYEIPQMNREVPRGQAPRLHRLGVASHPQANLIPPDLLREESAGINTRTRRLCPWESAAPPPPDNSRLAPNGRC